MGLASTPGALCNAADTLLVRWLYIIGEAWGRKARRGRTLAPGRPCCRAAHGFSTSWCQAVLPACQHFVHIPVCGIAAASVEFQTGAARERYDVSGPSAQREASISFFWREANLPLVHVAPPCPGSSFYRFAVASPRQTT